MTICGCGGVGKSCIAQRLNGNSFIDEYDPTIEDTYQRVIQIGDLDPMNISILDTSGQEGFKSFRQTWLKNCDVILLVYSIISYNSYQEIMQDWTNEIHENARNARLKILVGNKADLTEKRKVQLSDGYKFAEMYDMMFIEVSAKTGYNMNLLVYSLMKQIEERGISHKKHGVVDLKSSIETQRPSRNKCC